MKNITLLLVLTLISCKSSLLAQNTGGISGVVHDSFSGEVIPGANVYVEIDGEKIGGSTDMNGRFTIKSLKPGLYDVKVSFIGYSKITIINVTVTANSTTYLSNTKLSENTDNDIEPCGPPIFYRRLYVIKVSGEEIHNLPYR